MQQRTRLLLTAVALVAVWQLPYGRMALYPLTLLATFAHEMGHGLTALLTGASFDYLLLNSDGSGVAVWHGNPGPVALAAIAAGGLAGPSIAGSALLLLAHSPKVARTLLKVLAAALLVCAALWSRNAFGLAYLLGVAAVLLLAASKLPPGGAALVLHLIALTLCLSWFSHVDYMFAGTAHVNGALLPSDSAVMAQALGLRYWFWGGVVAALSLGLMGLGMWRVGRRRG